jgi:hypothetical protein
MVNVVGPPTVASGLAEIVTIGRTPTPTTTVAVFPATVAVTVASRFVARVVAEVPFGFERTEVELKDPAVLENVTGTP